MTKDKFLKILLFFGLLLLANLFLLREGFWFFQDAAYWPRTYADAVKMFMFQFHSFTNDGYYLGVDQGLFSFTRVLVASSITLLFFLFGQGGSQLVFTLIGYILAFFSFYLFSGIFFSNRNLRFVLTLLYVFNPLSYSLQGYVFFQAIIPLFIYSFQKYFYSTKDIRLSYLLLSVFSAFLWVSYIRFLQSNFFVIVSYIIYLFFIHKKQLPLKKVIIFITAFFLLFLPIIFSFTSQLLERSQTAFNYGNIFGKFVVQYPMYDAFNLFQSVAPKLYEAEIWPVIGTIFFAGIIYLILLFPKKERSGFYFLNLFLVILGITFFALANIFGADLYRSLLTIFSFIINEPYWGLYVLVLPLTVLIGLIFGESRRYLYIFSGLFILLATLPLLNLSDFQLQKFNLAKIPQPYYEYFIKPFNGIPEGSYFIPSSCWRAEFMDRANTPTFCPNYGYHYSPIFSDNPRIVSGDAYDLSQSLYSEEMLQNFKIISNLKYVFIANDIVIKKGPGPETGDAEIRLAKTARKIYDTSDSFIATRNENFTRYAFKDKDDYDFFIYSPASVVSTANKSLSDIQLNSSARPLIVNKEIASRIPTISQSAAISYKISRNAPTKYYLRLSGIDLSRPVLLQLNQTFGDIWKLKVISEAEYNKIPCSTEWKQYPITNNKRCLFEGNAVDYRDISLLGKPTIGEERHFRGNLVGNTWLLDFDNTRQQNQGNELYLVITNTKQIYFTYTIIISIFTFLLLSVFSIIQEIRKALGQS